MSNETLQQLLKRAHEDDDFRQQLRIAPRVILSEYDLTEEETQQLILPNFSWFVENKVAGTSYPWSEDALIILKALGVEALLSLTEQPLPSDLLTRIKLEAEHLPLADYTAPTIMQVEQSIATINSFLERGLPVAVHCGAGLGRTGTILACYLVWQGTSAEMAITSVRAQRPGSIETAGQEAVVGLYEHHRSALRSRHKREQIASIDDHH
jgi:atypical dual specificity phosphatase